MDRAVTIERWSTVTKNLQPSKDEVVKINTPTSLSYQCLSLSEPNQKSEDKADQLIQSLEINVQEKRIHINSQMKTISTP